MIAYYISYGEPPRRRFTWLRILGIIAAILIAGAIAGVIIWMVVAGDSGPTVASPANAGPAAVPFAAAIPAVYQENTNTLFLVDVSGSIAESDHLEPMRTALASIALGDTHPDIHQTVATSRAGLMTFSDATQTAITLGPLHNDEARRNEWLATASGLQTEPDAAGTFIYDAVADAHTMILEGDNAGKVPVIVLLSDGIDGGVGECRPATADDVSSGYCVGKDGDPVPCDDAPGGRSIGMMCERIPSDTSPSLLLGQLAVSAKADGLTVHTIGYGHPDSHQWLKLAAEATGGQYIYAER